MGDCFRRCMYMYVHVTIANDEEGSRYSAHIHDVNVEQYLLTILLKGKTWKIRALNTRARMYRTSTEFNFTDCSLVFGDNYRIRHVRCMIQTYEYMTLMHVRISVTAVSFDLGTPNTESN